MKTNTKMLTILVLALGLATEVANADFVFGEPTNLGPTVNSSAAEGVPSISSAGLSLYFGSNRDGGWDLWVATRETVWDPWGEPVNLGPLVNSSAAENGPRISADGLSLYFHSKRSGGYGEADLWVSTRETTSDPWGDPVNLGSGVNSSAYDAVPSISADGLRLFFGSKRPGGYGGWDILVTTRATKDDDWSAPVNLGPVVNSSYREAGPCISADDLVLFFVSDQSGGEGGKDLWVATWDTIGGDWGTPVNLGPTVNSSADDFASDISADGSTLFFSSTRSGGMGGMDLWQAPLIPIVDLNADGIVDAADMCIMVDHWGTDEPLCDIGPMPWGDGIVDVQDLIVLAEHLFEEIPPVEPVE